MTTLAIGSSVTLSVGDGGSFNLSTGGGLALVTVTPTVGTVSVVNLGPLAERRKFGIFTEGAQVTVANLSCAGFDYDYAGSGLTQDQIIAVQGLVSGRRTVDAGSRSITKDDNGAFLAPTAALTYTIPAGLSPMPSFTVDCPPTGAVTVAASGGATINGAATFLTRTRAANPVGFVVLSHEADAYGVSGA